MARQVCPRRGGHGDAGDMTWELVEEALEPIEEQIVRQTGVSFDGVAVEYPMEVRRPD